jgi:hypothetical protein
LIETSYASAALYSAFYAMQHWAREASGDKTSRG